jgi:hypothetical protein
MIISELFAMSTSAIATMIGFVLIAMAMWASLCTLFYVRCSKTQCSRDTHNSRFESYLFWACLIGLQLLGWVGGVQYLFSVFVFPLISDRITAAHVESDVFPVVAQLVLWIGLLSFFVVPSLAVIAVMLRKEVLWIPVLLLRGRWRQSSVEAEKGDALT